MKKNKMDENIREDEGKKKKETSPEEIRPYMKQGFLSRIPYSVKAIFMKWWFFGCGCFFVLWGLSNFFGGDTSTNAGISMILAIVLALFNGVVTDLMVDNLLLLMDTDKRESQWYMMFHNGKLYSLFINIVYSFLVTFASVITIDLIAFALDQTIGNAGPFENGVEPILCGIICLIFDLLFIGIKDLIVYYVRKKKAKKTKEETNV